jgi:hypothetical protein
MKMTDFSLCPLCGIGPQLSGKADVEDYSDPVYVGAVSYRINRTHYKARGICPHIQDMVESENPNDLLRKWNNLIEAMFQ